MAQSPAPLHTPSGEGRVLQIGGFGIIYKVPDTGADGGASVVEHTLAPGSLAAPLHPHRHEGEISYVLEGETITTAGIGSYGVKPREIFHAFWNSGATPARLVSRSGPDRRHTGAAWNARSFPTCRTGAARLNLTACLAARPSRMCRSIGSPAAARGPQRWSGGIRILRAHPLWIGRCDGRMPRSRRWGCCRSSASGRCGGDSFPRIETSAPLSQ